MDVIIGIGNDLRGDDGIGLRVVNAIPDRPGLETMTIHQLVPELAEKIRFAHRVLFVDAGLEGDAICLTPVEPAPHSGLGHACSPAALLGWTELAFAQAPQSWMLSIPGSSFEFGDEPNPHIVARIPEALKRIESWLNPSSEPVLNKEPCSKLGDI